MSKTNLATLPPRQPKLSLQVHAIRKTLDSIQSLALRERVLQARAETPADRRALDATRRERSREEGVLAVLRGMR